LQLRTRSVLRDPKDAKSRYTQRYWITESPGNGIIAKNRLSVIGGKSFLPAEMIFDPETNQGTFQDFYNRATKAYSEFLAKSVVMAQAK